MGTGECCSLYHDQYVVLAACNLNWVDLKTESGCRQQMYKLQTEWFSCRKHNKPANPKKNRDGNQPNKPVGTNTEN
jgi:hypothetical protein